MRSVRSTFALALIALSAAMSSNAPQVSAMPARPEWPPGQWSMHMSGPARHGRTRVVGAQTPTLAWRIDADTNGGGAAVGRDGTIYTGTFSGSQMLAIRPNGTLKWARPATGAVNATPAILLDGRIAFVDEAGTISVLNPNGTPSWRYETGTGFSSPSGAPAVGRDGTLYTGIDGTVYAFHPDGSIRWTYTGDRGVGGPVGVAPDGTVYYASNGLAALDPEGQLLWHIPELLQLGGSPAIASDGTIYVNAHDSTIYAFNPDGTTKWFYQADDCCEPDVPSSPAIGRDGTVYVGMALFGQPEADGVMFAFNPDGTIKWEAHYGDYPTAPAVGGDGTIYYGGGSGAASVYALNPDGTLKWQHDESAGYVRTPPALGKGRVYAGTELGFFAVGP